MTHQNITAVVLAAGKGTRMKSKTPKVLQGLAGKPLVMYVLESASQAGCSSTIIVDNKDASIQKGIQGYQKNCQFVIQDPPLGTGHAVLEALPLLPSNTDQVLIMYGDVPLIKPETLISLIDQQNKSGAIITFATAILDRQPPYGRIIRDANGSPIEIIEAKDISPEQKKINEFNVGLYLVKADFLKSALKDLSTSNAQHEYYLTDLVKMASQKNLPIQTIHIHDEVEWQGVNNFIDLARVEKRVLSDRRRRWQLEGVRFFNADQVYLDAGIVLAPDVQIHGPCRIEGSSSVATDVIIEMGCVIKSSKIATGSHIKAHSYIESSIIGSRGSVGPFAHLRPGSELDDEVKIGNFVEIKKTKMGKGSKASHLSYLGDALVGSNVNIGCGTITCNYDGYNKYQTIIEDGVFIGSDSQLVAPVTVGKNAFVGAGSTITKNIAPDSLGVTRAEQREIGGWASKFKAKALKIIALKDK